jgi:hypothetical protein
MNELFDIPVSKSPRLQWIERHGIQTHHAPHMKEDGTPWSAWLPSNQHSSGLPMDPEACGYGMTEDEAMIDLAIKNRMKGWNETP